MGDKFSHLILWLFVFYVIGNATGTDFCTTVNDSSTFPWTGAALYASSDLSVDPDRCKDECFQLNQTIAAVWKNLYCFCASDLLNMLNRTVDCTTVDGFLTGKSQGSDILYIYEVSPNTVEYINSDVSSLTFTSTQHLMDPPGVSVGYKYSWSDRADIWEYSTTNSIQRKPYSNGVYSIITQAVRQSSKFKINQVSKEYMVYSDPTGLNFTCQPYGVVFILAKCTIQLTTGSKITAELSVDNVIYETFQLAEAGWSRAGSVVNYYSTEFVMGISVAGRYLLNAEFQYPGTITHVEYNAAKTAKVFQLALVNPVCAGGTTFCFSTLGCSADPQCSSKLTCAGPNFYCLAKLACSNTCDRRLFNSYNETTVANDYKVSKIASITTGPVGYNIYKLPVPWPVEVGSRLMIVTSEADVIATASLRSMESPDYFVAGANLAVGEAVTKATLVSKSVQHQITALSQSALSTKIMFMVNTTGNKDIKVKLTSPSNVFVEDTKKMYIGHKINDTQILGKTFALLNEAKNYDLKDHTGANLTYFWNFGDSSPIKNTSTDVTSHTYTSMGNFLIVVNITNYIDHRQVNLTVQVITRVVIASVTGSTDGAYPNEVKSYTVVLTSGTNYNCTLSGEGITTNVTSNEPNLALSHKWTTENFYNVRIDCFNEMSISHKEWRQPCFHRIEGLAFDPLGGETNAAGTIKFKWTQGSLMNFTFLFDNQTKTVTQNAVAKTGESESITVTTIGRLIGVLRAENPVSDVIIVANLTFALRVVNLKIVPDKIHTSFGSPILFNVTMDQGSSMDITVQYGDGLNDTLKMTPEQNYFSNMSNSHNYAAIGEYEVNVTTSNIVGNTSAIVKVYVLDPLGTYTLNTNVVFLEKNNDFTFNLVRQTGNDPVLANLTVDYKDGTTPLFKTINAASETVPVTHQFAANNEYNVTIILQNPINSVSLSVLVTVLDPITNFRCENTPPHTFNNNPMKFKAMVDLGSRIDVVFHPGGSETIQNYNWGDVTIANSEHTFTHTYATVNNYTANITASNPLGKKECIKQLQIQYKVIRSEFTVTPTTFVELGKKTDIRLDFSGTNFPSGMSAVFTFEDGSPPFTKLLYQSDMPYTHSHIVTKEGRSNVTVKLENLASSETYTKEIGAFEKFENFAMTITWGASRSPGFGAAKTRFPVKQNIYFKPDLSGKGTIETIEFFTVSMKNPSDIFSCNVTLVNQEFMHMWQDTGDFNVSMVLRNPISHYVKGYILNIGGSMKDSRIIIPENTLMPMVMGKVRVVWSAIDIDACICIDMGNQTKLIFGATSGCSKCSDYTYANRKPANNELLLRVRYQKIGDYNIKVYIYNDFESTETNHTLPISRVDCQIPQIQMKIDSHILPETPQVGQRGLQNIIVAEISNIQCEVTKENVKRWTAQSVDPEYFRVQKSINLDSLDTSNNTQLIIPPRTLPIGLYKLTFTVVMNKNKTIQTFINYNVTYLKVTSTNILVSLSTGGLNEITAGDNAQICLYPKKYSRDFDLDVQDFSAWNWTWKCREFSETFTSTEVSPKPTGHTFVGSRTGCFGDGPGIAKFSDSSAPCFWSGNMMIGKKYEMVVMGSVGAGADKRKGESKMLISVVLGKPPIINIQCIREKLCRIKKDGKYAYQEVSFNPSDDLLIKATCEVPGSTEKCKFGSWIIEIYNTTDSTWIPLNAEDANTYIKGINSLEMSLLSKFWSVFITTRFKACYRAKFGTAVGKSCIQFFVNLLPSNITCHVDKVLASQTETVCCNCTYKDGLDYMFKVSDEKTLTTLGFNDKGYFCSLVPYSVKMVTYSVRVTNRNGGFIDVKAADIRTTKLNPTDMEKVLKEITSTDALTTVNAKGDYKKMAEIYLKYVSIMSVSNKNDIKGIFGNATENTKTSFGGTGYDSEIDESKPVKEIEDLSPEIREKLEDNRNKKADMLNKMTRHLDVMVPADIPGLYLVSGVVKSIADSFDTLNREGQGQVANKLVHLATNLRDMESQASKEDVVKISESLLTACFMTDTAASTQMRSGIKDDIKRSEIYIDYDVSINSDEESYLEQDPNEASRSLKLDTNSKFQGKVAYGVKGNNDRSLEIISKVLRDVSVIDDKPIDIKTSNLEYYVMKTKPDELIGQNYTKGRSHIQLPDVCKSFSMTSTECKDPNNPIGIEIMATPTNVRAFLANPNGKGLPILVNSEVVSLSLFTGKKETESELKQPDNGHFTFTIARDPSMKLADFIQFKPRPTLPKPVKIPGSGNIYQGPKFYEQKLVMHKFNLTGNDQSIHFQMKIEGIQKKCTQFLVVARLGVPPRLSESPDGKIDKENFTFWGMIPTHTRYCNYTDPPNTPNPFIFFVDNYKYKAAKVKALDELPKYSKTRHVAFFGVRELERKDWNKFTQNNRPHVPFDSSAQINTSYSTRVFSSGCYHFDTKVGGSWGTIGCQVGALTTTKYTQCICNHLTSFSSGWILPPNTIDFDYIFSNFKIEENMTIFITEGVIIFLSILIMIWARRKDNKDLEKVGVTPLADNDVDDLYLYEVIVDTSIRNGAGTSSNVFFILSGESDETEVRKLEDSKRSILKRGNVDRFLLAVPRSLGKLQYIRLWHDNSGKGRNASWYCNNIGVTDLQTKEKTFFIVNKWFAVEEGDGQIDRLISVAGDEELRQFGQVFTSKMKQDLTEDHLWLSVMARPPESRFTRLERVACCLLLLFLTMLTTCMFYETEGPTPSQSTTLTVGPFAISAKEVWTGLISNIIGFVPLFIIIELFRRSHLKNSHGNKLRKAVEQHFGGPISSVDFPNRIEPVTSRSSNSIAPLTDNEERQSTGSRPNTPGYRDPEQVNVQVVEVETSEEKERERKMKIVQKKLFPWWVRVITWILWSLVFLTAIVFTTLYGIQFGDEACKKWISSMFISFFASVLLTQPIKVVLLAMFFSLICRKTDKMEQIELMDDENALMNELGQRNGLRDDEEFLHNDLYNGPLRPQRKTVQPISKEEIERAREARLREMKIFDVVREILFYMIYFTTLLVVTYSLRDPNSFTLKTQIERVFIQGGTEKFLSIRTEEQFWNWGVNVLVPALRAPVWYNNMPQLFQRGFTIDRSNRLIGYAVIRQIRVKKNSCKVYSYVKHMTDSCYAAYSATTEETLNYTVGWQKPNANLSQHDSYSYKTAAILDGLPYAGMLTFYSGGGYVHEFKGNISNVHKKFIELRDTHWIDGQTRAIFIEFTTYNPNINLFAVNTLLLEFPGTGGMWPSYRVEPANLLGLYTSGVAAFEIFCQVLYGIFIIVMIVKEIRKITKEKLRYFTDFWNLCEIFLIFGSFACVAAFAYVMIATGDLTEKFSRYGGKIYIKFQKVAMWNEYLSYLVSFIVFVATLKFIRLLRFNKRMGMLGAVLSYSAKDMKQFFIIFAIMFSAFVMVFYSLFMDSLYRYHTFLHATEASMQIALGKFEFLELYEKEPIFGPIVFAFFVIFIIFVMLNMFIAILNEGFAMVRADVELQSNDFELLDFMFTKIVMWTGLTNTAMGQKLISTGITDQVYRDRDAREVTERVNAFPDKVDQLLSHINKIITTGNNTGNSKGRAGSDNKSFNSVIFEKDDNHDQPDVNMGSRPGTASSNIIRVKPQASMTPIDQ